MPEPSTSIFKPIIPYYTEQGKEIGLLRAVGVTRPWIAAVYSLEAMVQPQKREHLC